MRFLGRGLVPTSWKKIQLLLGGLMEAAIDIAHG